MSKDKELFTEMRKQLLEKGYREKDVTMTSGKAMTLGLLYALPFVLVFGLFFRFVLLERAYLTEGGGLTFYLMFLAIIVVSVFIHELLHGIGWAISSGQGWSIVRFNISALMPSCACKVPLKKRQYLIGVFMPLVVLGFGSILFLLLYPGTISLLTILVNFVAAGADLVIAFSVFKEGEALIADHPTQAGYVAFYK